MAEEVKKPEAEPAKPAPEKTEVKPEEKKPTEVKPEEKKAEPEKTIEEMKGDEKPAAPNMVPESAFLGEKKARKAAEKELKALRDLVEGGGSKSEISASIAELAEEHDIDKNFLQKFASAIKAETEKELDEKYSSRFESKDKQEKFDTIFNKAYQVALERAPEYKDLANSSVIKSLSVLPENAKKTLTQILEETYGNAVSGKRTIEHTSPGGGKDPEPLNFEKARKDSKYFDEVMADPALKKEYNKLMLEKGF